METQTQSTLMDKQAVYKRLAISPRTLEYMTKGGQFPPPVRIGKHV